MDHAIYNPVAFLEIEKPIKKREITTIRVTKETLSKLRRRKRYKLETYEEILLRLMEKKDGK